MYVQRPLREIPVVESDEGCDAAGLESGNHVLVVLDAFWVFLADAMGQNPGPRDGEPVVGGSHLTDQPRVLLVVGVTVAGRLTIGPVGDRPLELSECVPNTHPLATRIPASLDLSISNAFHLNLQGTAKRLRPGLVNFVPAVAYHFCLNLPAAFTKPG